MVFDSTQRSQPTAIFLYKKNQRLFSCKIRSLSLSFRHFGIRRVNITWNNRLMGSCVEQTSKIWCKNIHAFPRNCGFRVGAFYFDASCIRWPSARVEVPFSVCSSLTMSCQSDPRHLWSNERQLLKRLLALSPWVSVMKQDCATYAPHGLGICGVHWSLNGQCLVIWVVTGHRVCITTYYTKMTVIARLTLSTHFLFH